MAATGGGAKSSVVRGCTAAGVGAFAAAGSCIAAGVFVTGAESASRLGCGGTGFAVWGAVVFAPLVGAGVFAAGGVGVMAARKGYVAEVDDELQSVLDGIASGDRPPSALADLTARLMRTSRVGNGG